MILKRARFGRFVQRLVSWRRFAREREFLRRQCIRNDICLLSACFFEFVLRNTHLAAGPSSQLLLQQVPAGSDGTTA